MIPIYHFATLAISRVRSKSLLLLPNRLACRLTRHATHLSLEPLQVVLKPRNIAPEIGNDAISNVIRICCSDAIRCPGARPPPWGCCCIFLRLWPPGPRRALPAPEAQPGG